MLKINDNVIVSSNGAAKGLKGIVIESNEDETVVKFEDGDVDVMLTKELKSL